MMRHPPRSTLFPHATLFRSALVTNSDLPYPEGVAAAEVLKVGSETRGESEAPAGEAREGLTAVIDRKSTRLNSSHANISYAVFCLKNKRRERTSTMLNSSNS